MTAVAGPQRPSARGGALALVAALSLGLVVACTSDDGGDATTSTAAVTAPTSTSAAEQTTRPPSTSEPQPVRWRVAVVSDSEVTPEIVEGLEAVPGIEVVSSVTRPGHTMAQLDDPLAEALAAEPDVVVYSAGANDLEALGPQGMLDALRPRIERIMAATCAVYPVPAIDTSAMEPAEAEQVTTILDGFETVLGDWGARTVSYPAIAADFEARGEDFFAEGELGSFHPGRAAYGAITDEIAAAVESCDAPA